MTQANHITIEGKRYNLIWGFKDVVVSDGHAMKAKIEKGLLERMAVEMGLANFVAQEMIRQA